MSGPLPLPNRRPWRARLRTVALAIATVIQGLLEGGIALLLLGHALLQNSVLRLQLLQLRRQHAALLLAVEQAQLEIGRDWRQS